MIFFFATSATLRENFLCMNKDSRLSDLNLKFHSFLIFLVLLSAASCRKADRDTDTATEMVSDNAHSTYFFNDMFVQMHQLALSDSSINSIGSFFLSDTACIDTITHTNLSGNFPDTIIVNYGLENGAACADGNLRRGKLKIIFNGKYGTTSRNCVVFPENYYLNDYKMEGQMTISGKGRNTSNNLYFSIQIDKGIISNDSIRLEYFSPANGQTASFQREWISGESTPDINDDVFQLTGTYGGTASKGTTYKSEISTALKDQIDCKWISAGKEIITPLNLSPREVDYGSGCDKNSNVTINGKKYDVTLLP